MVIFCGFYFRPQQPKSIPVSHTYILLGDIYTTHIFESLEAGA